jgi:hypothetical protein
MTTTTELVEQRVAQLKDSARIDAGTWGKGRNAIIFIALVAWVAAGAGYFTDQPRFFQSYLNGFLWSTTIVLAAIFFTMIQYLTGSAWSVPMRRILENMGASIWVGPLLFLPVAFGLHSLYEWSHADVVAKDHLLQAKQAYLNPQAFFIRAAVYFLIWIVWSSSLLRNSRKQDANADLKYMHNNSRWSAPGLLVMMLSVSLAAFDWSMSLDPHWYSTIFGLYVFAGGAWAMFAVWTLICIGFRKQGILANTIRTDHFHDLGKWMFALTVFWAYIAFSQYLLIWYANIPEETVWYLHRLEGSWKWWSAAVLIGHFIFPFLLLILRRNKRNLQVLTFAAIWFLVFHFVDTYFQVMPTFQKHGVALHWLDLAGVFAPASIYALAFWSLTKKSNLLPTGDPRFELGIHFHQTT